MTAPRDKYAEYVLHPRYGRGPKVTGLNPDPLAPGVTLHWNATTSHEVTQGYSRDVKRIPNTAIEADLTRQTPATFPVTHYFDLERTCWDCRKSFIFFAAEQKHWYEELGFGLDSDCLRCVPCRKQQQGIARKRQRYEELFHEQKRTNDQNLEMAECCLALMESSTFSRRQTERVRMLLNQVDDADDATRSRCNELLARARLLETEGGG